MQPLYAKIIANGQEDVFSSSEVSSTYPYQYSSRVFSLSAPIVSTPLSFDLPVALPRDLVIVYYHDQGRLVRSFVRQESYPVSVNYSFNRKRSRSSVVSFLHFPKTPVNKESPSKKQASAKIIYREDPVTSISAAPDLSEVVTLSIENTFAVPIEDDPQEHIPQGTKAREETTYPLPFFNDTILGENTEQLKVLDPLYVFSVGVLKAVNKKPGRIILEQDEDHLKEQEANLSAVLPNVSALRSTEIIWESFDPRTAETTVDPKELKVHPYAVPRVKRNLTPTEIFQKESVEKSRLITRVENSASAENYPDQ